MFPFSLLNSGILDSHPTVPGPYPAPAPRSITPKEIFTDYNHVMTHLTREWRTKGRVQRKPAKERVKRAPDKERVMKPDSVNGNSCASTSTGDSSYRATHAREAATNVPKKNPTHAIRKKNSSKRRRHAHVPT